MKPVLKRLIITAIIIAIVSIITLPTNDSHDDYESYITQNIATNFANTYTDVDEFNVEKEKEEQRKKAIVYEGMTLNELSAQLNKSLNSTISNKGELIASYSLEVGVDPVLATAIILHETGCEWECSYLVKKCNNVGGVKGSPGCNGSYKRYSTLDEGIKQFIDNLYNNYYAYGLDSPEKMNKKYAQSTTWSSKVNSYISSIKEK